MAYAHVASVALTPAIDGNTSSSIDTSGASLLFMAVAHGPGTNNPTVSDSYSNTWIALTSRAATGATIRTFYVKNPIVGSGHTFTVSGTDVQHASYAAAFSGAPVDNVLDAQNGSNTEGSVTSISPGFVAIDGPGELFITAVSTADGSSSHTLSATYTKLFNTNSSTGVNPGGGLGFRVTNNASNPSWSWTGSTTAAVNIAIFKPYRSVPPSRPKLPVSVIRAATY